MRATGEALYRHPFTLLPVGFLARHIRGMRSETVWNFLPGLLQRSLAGIQTKAPNGTKLSVAFFLTR